jgi:hypothetical protein
MEPRLATSRYGTEQAKNKVRIMSSKVIADDNPKIALAPRSNTEKDADDWVSGDDAMTSAQASYLKTLSEQIHEPEAFDEALTKAEASKRIDALKERLKAAPRLAKCIRMVRGAV